MNVSTRAIPPVTADIAMEVLIVLGEFGEIHLPRSTEVIIKECREGVAEPPLFLSF